MTTIYLNREDNVRIYDALKVGSAVDWKLYEKSSSTNVGPLESEIRQLVSSLKKLQSKFPAKLPTKSPSGPEFDAKACVIIHKGLKLSPFAQCEQGFWCWLSLKYFWDLINWRHGNEDGFAIHDNFSMTKRFHGFVERLWFRAELGQVDGPDPYRVVEAATSRDFWESGIVRHTYSSNRAIARAFVKYQFGVPWGRLHLTDENGVRALYKRICRSYASTCLDVLDDAQADALIADLAKGLSQAKPPKVLAKPAK